jgi:hypothetical protein
MMECSGLEISGFAEAPSEGIDNRDGNRNIISYQNKNTDGSSDIITNDKYTHGNGIYNGCRTTDDAKRNNNSCYNTKIIHRNLDSNISRNCTVINQPFGYDNLSFDDPTAGGYTTETSDHLTAAPARSEADHQPEIETAVEKRAQAARAGDREHPAAMTAGTMLAKELEHLAETILRRAIQKSSLAMEAETARRMRGHLEPSIVKDNSPPIEADHHQMVDGVMEVLLPDTSHTSESKLFSEHHVIEELPKNDSAPDEDGSKDEPSASSRVSSQGSEIRVTQRATRHVHGDGKKAADNSGGSLVYEDNKVMEKHQSQGKDNYTARSVAFFAEEKAEPVEIGTATDHEYVTSAAASVTRDDGKGDTADSGRSADRTKRRRRQVHTMDEYQIGRAMSGATADGLGNNGDPTTATAARESESDGRVLEKGIVSDITSRSVQQKDQDESCGTSHQFETTEETKTDSGPETASGRGLDGESKTGSGKKPAGVSEPASRWEIGFEAQDRDDPSVIDEKNTNKENGCSPEDDMSSLQTREAAESTTE